MCQLPKAFELVPQIKQQDHRHGEGQETHRMLPKEGFFTVQGITSELFLKSNLLDNREIQHAASQDRISGPTWHHEAKQGGHGAGTEHGTAPLPRSRVRHNQLSYPGAPATCFFNTTEEIMLSTVTCLTLPSTCPFPLSTQHHLIDCTDSFTGLGSSPSPSTTGKTR